MVGTSISFKELIPYTPLTFQSSYLIVDIAHTLACNCASYEKLCTQAGMADIDAVWHEFDDQPDMLARGWILRDPEEDYGIPYDSKRLHERGALVVGGAGISHRLTVAQDPVFAPGRYLQLRLEPDNPVDPNAVAIWDAECRLQIGYVPADHAPEVARRLSAREQLYALCLMEFVSAMTGERRGIRLLIAPLAFRLNFSRPGI
jgi:hypothetical protein